MAINLYKNIVKSGASSTARLRSRQAVPMTAVYEDVRAAPAATASRYGPVAGRYEPVPGLAVEPEGYSGPAEQASSYELEGSYEIEGGYRVTGSYALAESRSQQHTQPPAAQQQQQQRPQAPVLRRWQCASRSALLESLTSAVFQQEVFEREVALLHLPRAEVATLPGLEEILREPWVDTGSRGDHRPTPGQRALCFVDGSFVAASAAATGEGAIVDGSTVTAALSRGHTLISHAVQLWSRDTARLCLQLSDALNRTINANLYCCDAGLQTALAPHNDSQCVFIWQLEGSKRWQIWLREAALLPVDDRRVFGKHSDRQLERENLGQPDFTLVLQPGDVMYLPRGVIHATDTVDCTGGSSPSVHLTVGVDSWPVDDFTTGGSLLGLTMPELLGSVLGGSDTTPLPPLWHEAVQQLQNDVEFRRSVPVGSGREDAWAAAVRAALHRLVDAAMDEPEVLRDIQEGYATRLEEWRVAMAALARG